MVKIEIFFLNLFQKISKNISKFLIDFFIRYENNLNNYWEIFSKDFKIILKKINENYEDNKNNTNDVEIGIQYTEIPSKTVFINEFVKFFDLNLKKSNFVVYEKNLILKSKFFSKILKNIIKSKGLMKNYNVINPNSSNVIIYNHTNIVNKHNSNYNFKGNLNLNKKFFIFFIGPNIKIKYNTKYKKIFLKFFSRFVYTIIRDSI